MAKVEEQPAMGSGHHGTRGIDDPGTLSNDTKKGAFSLLEDDLPIAVKGEQSGSGPDDFVTEFHAIH